MTQSKLIIKTLGFFRIQFKRKCLQNKLQKPCKKTLRNAGFVLDDFATHIDKKQLSFRHPYVYTGMAIAALGVMIANKHYGFGLY